MVLSIIIGAADLRAAEAKEVLSMQFFQNMAPAGAIVIAFILILFVLAAALLFIVCARYRSLTKDIAQRGGFSPFAQSLREDYTAAYRQFGENTNTPAIINNCVSTKLGKLLFAERFINNAVSLFVTLGLFGTFLGLALSVSSLTELLSTSSSEEWLNILDNVGSGLFSALSGMGVAFYTSLVGVACSIVFTLLRAIWNPQAMRDALEMSAELWLDHTVAPQLPTEAATDDNGRLITLKKELRAHAAAVERSLNDCTDRMQSVLSGAATNLRESIDYSKEPLRIFYETVQLFNDNVRDFSSINYDLRGSIERMDLAVRDFGSALHKAERAAHGDRRDTAAKTRGGNEQ